MKYVFSILPLLIGGFLYLGYRTERLLMFDWVDNLGLRPTIYQFRLFCTEHPLPSWIYYSLPNGLWLLSYMLLISVIWDKKDNAQYLFWMYFLPIIALISELLQLFISKLGTFDIVDVSSYLLAILTFKIIETWEANKMSCH